MREHDENGDAKRKIAELLNCGNSFVLQQEIFAFVFAKQIYSPKECRKKFDTIIRN